MLQVLLTSSNYAKAPLDSVSASSADDGDYDCSVTANIVLGASSTVLTQWFFPGGPETFSQTTTYGVANVSVQNPCGVSIQTYFDEDLKINIYPTLSNGEFTLQVNDLQFPLTVEIYNCLGQLEKSTEITNTKTQINLIDSSPGLYYIWLKTPKFTQSKNFIIY